MWRGEGRSVEGFGVKREMECVWCVREKGRVRRRREKEREKGEFKESGATAFTVD